MSSHKYETIIKNINYLCDYLMNLGYPPLRREARLDDLPAYRMALLSFEDQLLATIEPCEASGDSEAESPSEIHQNVRCAGHECPASLQPTNLTSYEFCNAVRHEPTSLRPSGKPDDSNSNP